MFSTTFACATESCEPTIRNSNLLPVKANGDVRLRSVASFMKSGSVLTPVSKRSPDKLWVAVPVLTSCSITSSSCSPKNTDKIAGGASFAPSLWSFPTSAADALRRAACLSVARRIHVSTSRNWMFSCGVSPGSNKLIPSSVVSDQLSCFPEPFTPANGFSCKRQ